MVDDVAQGGAGLHDVVYGAEQGDGSDEELDVVPAVLGDAFAGNLQHLLGGVDAGDSRVAGQAQREYPVGAGKGGDDPSPARRALLVSVQQQERRPGAGLEVLGCESVDGDAGWADGFNPRSRRTGW